MAASWSMIVSRAAWVFSLNCACQATVVVHLMDCLGEHSILRLNGVVQAIIVLLIGHGCICGGCILLEVVLS